ncbi:MAG: hypothetical protein AAGB26_03915 [Planctomycetota bacterium]
MRLAAIILLLFAMVTFSVGVNNYRDYEPEGEDAAAQGRAFGYAVGTFAPPALALGAAWYCWRKSFSNIDDRD